MPFLGLILGRLMDPTQYFLLPLKTVLTPCLVKLFRLCLSTSTFLSCWKYSYVQPVPKKGDRSNPFSYRPNASVSCLAKALETILNRKFLKHLSSFNFLSDHQYGFRKGRSTGDLLAFLTDSWAPSLSRFGETFAVAQILRRLAIESGTKLCCLNYPRTDSIPLFLSCLVSFQAVLFLL